MNHHNLLPAAAVGIPLHCNICPKKPDFSDVSHLLTHIGSKAHLSNYFKTKVKAASDAASKRIVEEYDLWYEGWNVQDMMSERYDQKERKKSGTVGVRGGNDSRRTSGATSVASGRNTPMPSHLAGRRLRENTLDPQLGTRIKQEPKSRSATPASGYAMEYAALNRAYAPPMQAWPTTPYGATSMRQERPAFDSVYTTPSSGSSETDFLAPSYDAGQRRTLSGSTRSQAIEDDADFEETVNDSMRLKGIVWPGMDLFDSATLDMRRKRNQKKAISVVQFLQATSEVVEPTELVFDADGMLTRERPITGNPEEEDGQSPLPGEEMPSPEYQQPKKKPGRRPRSALAEKNVNTGRILRKGRDRRPPTRARTSRATPYYDMPGDDDELTYGRHAARRRTGLSIHRDNTGPEITFDHPAPMSMLNSSFHHPFQSALNNSSMPFPSAPQYRGGGGGGHQPQPSFPYDLRPSQNHSLGLPAPNFGTFGQLSGSSMFQNSNFHSNNSLNNGNSFSFGGTGQQALAAFQQQFGIVPPPTLSNCGQDNGASMFQVPNNQSSALQNQNPWDFLGPFGQADLGMSNGAGDASTFNLGGDFGASSVNPLFISSGARGPGEDDEATISPPSDH